MPWSRLHSFSSALVVTGLILGGCGGSGSEAADRKPTSAAPSATATPPPTYSADAIEKALLKPAEISRGMQNLEISLLPLRDKRLPLCSLTGMVLPGKPDITIRQMNAPQDTHSEKKFAQVIVRYPDPATAAGQFTAVQGKIRACPKKQHVGSKKVPDQKFTLFAHDDTWKLSEDSVAGWSHIRGVEKQLFSSAQTTNNVLYFVYDYAFRGNVLVTSLYWERAKPSDSADPVAKRATDVLTKQLQKLG
ncbi:sensor domain-containing protein [Actinomadura barringtoniae]|uniref:Sensor domain-containing protein n=1 Tax=Actinomadura barringtoniae TaxID=1427535 RepID=A0A939PLJ8_9ACTN|nr:sensor domain-containing protein [Actinomadura barringtoniae]MBO2454562.1 sensor domain-containing protein [Actinomadura barringtoniae]